MEDGRSATTLPAFLDDLAAAALPGTVVLKALSERHLYRSILAEHPGLLGPRRGVLPTGYVDLIARTVADCRGAEVGADALDDALPQQARGRKLAAFLRVYDAHLDDLGVVDRTSMPAAIADALGRGAPLPPTDRLPPDGEIVIEGVHRWTGSLVRLFNVLDGRVRPSGGSVTVRLPDDPDHRGFTYLVAVKKLFEALGGDGTVDLESHLPSREHRRALALDDLASRVFRSKPSQDEPLAAGEVRIFSAPHAAGEAREVAARVRDLVAGGMAPEDIVITARELTSAHARVADALTAVGVPVHDRRGRPVPSTGPVRVLLDLVRIAREGFAREGLLPLLTSAYVNLAGADDAVPLGPWTFSRWIREAGATDEHGEGYAAAVRRLASTVDAEKQPRRKAEGEAVAARLETAFEVFAQLARPGAVREHVTRLRRTARLLQLDVRVHAQAARLLAGEGQSEIGRVALDAVARDEAALRALDDALDDCMRTAAWLGRGDQSLDAAAFSALLGDALSARTLRPGALRGGAVRLVGADDLATEAVRAVFVIGLTDGEFPALGDEDPLLPDAERLKINGALGRPVFAVLTAEDRRMEKAPDLRAEETLRFMFALHAATENLTLSWPRNDDQERPLVPSPFVTEVLRVICGGAPDFERVDEVVLSPIPVCDRARRPHDLEVALCAEVFGPPPGHPGLFLPPEPLPTSVCEPLERVGVRLDRLVGRLRVERERHLYFLDRSVPPGPFSGACGPLSAEAGRAFRADAARPLSASALERLAGCGFRSFAGSVLRLDPLREHDEELTPLVFGNLVHECLERVWVRFEQDGLLPLQPGNLERALPLARKVAGAVCTGWAQVAHRGDKGLFAIHADQTLEMVGSLVEVEAAAHAEGWQFAGAEVKFGYEDGWPALEFTDPDDPAHKTFFRGRIDRLDQRTREGRQEVRVLDYKTSDASKLRKKLDAQGLGQTEFQLLVYWLAAQRAHPDAHIDAGYLAMKSRPPKHTLTLEEAVGGAHRSWKGFEGGVRAVLAGDSTRPSLAVRAFELLGAARAGQFGIRPVQTDICRWCEFNDVCRIVDPAEDE